MISFLQIQKKDIDFGRLIELAVALIVVLDVVLIVVLDVVLDVALIVVLDATLVASLIALVVDLVININHMNPILIDHIDNDLRSAFFLIIHKIDQFS